MVPLVTVVAVAGVTAPAAFAELTLVAAFTAHEPVLVLLGMRGLRARAGSHR
jgi:hypothetical protein